MRLAGPISSEKRRVQVHPGVHLCRRRLRGLCALGEAALVPIDRTDLQHLRDVELGEAERAHERRSREQAEMADRPAKKVPCCRGVAAAAPRAAFATCRPSGPYGDINRSRPPVRRARPRRARAGHAQGRKPFAVDRPAPRCGADRDATGPERVLAADQQATHFPRGGAACPARGRR